VVGVQWPPRLAGVPLKLWDLLWAFGIGSGRVDAAGPKPLGAFMLIAGVTDTEGVLLWRPRVGAGDWLTEMVGTSGVTLMDGAVTPLLSAGVSFTEILGIIGALPLVPRLAGDSLTDILGVGGVATADGVLDLRLVWPLTEIEGVSETEMDGIGGAGVVRERVEEDSETLMVGTGDAEGRVGMFAFLRELMSGSGLVGAGDGGSS